MVRDQHVTRQTPGLSANMIRNLPNRFKHFLLMKAAEEDQANGNPSSRVLSASLAFTVCLGTPNPAFATQPKLDHAEALLRFAQRWLGTPYIYGGDNTSGIDCSAYVRRIYREVLRIDMPRTTVEQIQLGEPFTINLSNLSESLKTGDLMFFVNKHGHPRHVVLYLKDGLITHSIEGRGVVIEPIEEIAGRFIAPRRVFKTKEGGGG